MSRCPARPRRHRCWSPVARTQVPSASRPAAPAAPFPLRPPTVPGSRRAATAESDTGADYDTEWARRYPARAARRAPVRGPRAPGHRGRGRPPTCAASTGCADLDGPVIFAANHHSHLDTAAAAVALPEPWRHHVFVGRRRRLLLRQPGHRRRCRPSSLDAIPIERTKVTRRSADQAAELIDDGWSMVIFPEGGRCPDGWGQPFRGGAAYLALRCGVPVVPVHLRGHRPASCRKGAQAARAAAAPWSRSARRCGPPTATTPAASPPASSAEVAALADEATTDWWRPARAPTPTRPRRSAAPTPAPGAAPGRSATAAPHQRDRRQGAAKIWP